MAIVVTTVLPNASRVEADEFDAGIEAAMTQRGGPPTGLMAHIAHPVGDGFQLINVWTSEATMRPFYDEVITPLLSRIGLETGTSVTAPVWTFARP